MIDKLDVYQRCQLLSKSVMINGNMQQVYGLARLRVKPRRVGMGRAILRGIESVAKQDNKFCIVAFCTNDVLPFYQKCGWHSNGIYEDTNILTSIPVESIEVTERW